MSPVQFTGEFAWGSHKNYTQNRVVKVGDQMDFSWSTVLAERDGATITIRQESAAWDAVAYFPVVRKSTAAYSSFLTPRKLGPYSDVVFLEGWLRPEIVTPRNLDFVAPGASSARRSKNRTAVAAVQSR